MNEETQLVVMTNGQATTTSREVAKVFGREHRDVLKAIDNLTKDFDEGVRNFSQTPMFTEETYVHSQNHQEYRQVRMNKDGFTLLAMGFTGSKATQFKLRYIQAFNEMEETLDRKSVV